MQKSEDSVEVYFEPPLWKQRRDWANSVISTQKVLDVGCGEGALLEILVNSTKFSHLAGLDIDSTSLYQAWHNVKPNQRDFDFLREKPLVLDLYHGSLIDYDPSLSKYESIVLLEVVEHLEPQVLKELPITIFGKYRPSEVLITTPNAEFNVYFKDLVGFRHRDHKFEWNRAEFQTWCGTIAEYYGYAVEFGGVGVLGKYNQSIGYCTQTAYFKRVSCLPSARTIQNDLITQIQLVKHVEYPYFSEQFSREEMINEILDNLEYVHIPDGQDFYRVLPISSLWDILRIRQVCKDYCVLVECLKSRPDKFAVQGNQFKILFRDVSKDLQFFSELSVGMAIDDCSWGSFAPIDDPW